MAHHSSGDPAWAHARAGTSSASVASAPASSDDPAWAHARVVPNAKNNTISLHCNKLIKGGGITRLKYHLVGIRGQVEPCKKVSSDIRFQMKQMIEDLKKSKQTKKRIQLEIGNPYDVEEEEDEVRVVEKSPHQTLAHCIDLMLENIANPRWFPLVDEAIKKAKKITNFIYNHGVVLDLMRQDFTNGRELCRLAITRFATNFLSLQSMLRFKKELRQMFTCDKWLSCSHAKTAVGKQISKIVLEDYAFWSQCKHIVKVSEPLVRVLHLVDGDEKLAMGYLYEAMDKAKEEIKRRLKNKVSLYGHYVRVIDTRWDKQLHSPLHAADCFLNLAIYFRPSFKRQNEVQRGLLSTLMRFVPDPDIQDKISSQLDEYKKSIGDFSTSLAIRQQERLNLVSWWEQFGLGAPDLQSFAIRVLSQCCSATGCERNWSTFVYVHSKKRNRLEHKRVNDLVFVHYNLRLRERNIQRNKYAMDRIGLDNIDLMGDWVAEEPALLNPDDINWDCLNEPATLVNVEEDAELETIDVDDDDDDDNNNDHVLTNLPMGANLSVKTK
ncbi:uncharacterized protein LOC115970212 [Quercus lobata]|uniref:uncharacterized protein LOC115970212 n=1 Tax=Quercus lobata TaxID=97700 RepID=UPI001244992C|nr:uncharacterized protein LOC115970212 [Quercus lobata]